MVAGSEVATESNVSDLGIQLFAAMRTIKPGHRMRCEGFKLDRALHEALTTPEAPTDIAKKLTFDTKSGVRCEQLHTMVKAATKYGHITPISDPALRTYDFYEVGSRTTRNEPVTGPYNNHDVQHVARRVLAYMDTPRRR